MGRGQFRIHGGHVDYGHVCPGCAGPKTPNARSCRQCYREALHDDLFWQRRTCACGGPKHQDADRCLRCENTRRVGIPPAELRFAA